MNEDHVLYDKDPRSHVATVTMNRPERRNAMTTGMYDRIIECLDDAAEDDDVKVVLLRGAGGCFTSGMDLAEVYSWYGDGGKSRRPSQRRRLVVDRRTTRVYHRLQFHPKATVTMVQGYALGGGLEFLMASDLSVVGEGAQIGMPATRFLGPVLGDLHLFFHRLGPVLAKDLLLTGRVVRAGDVAHLGVFSRCVPDAEVEETAQKLARLVGRMPADGIVIAKEAYRMVEQSMGLGISEVSSYLLHAYGTNLSFEPDEFNFVRVRSKLGLSKTLDAAERYFNGEVEIEALLNGQGQGSES